MKIKKIVTLFLLVCSLGIIASCANDEVKPDTPQEQVEKIVPVFEGINLVDNKDVIKVSKKKPIDLIPSIGEDSHVKYYAPAGSKAEVEVHLYNPDQFEILSFTLNDRKYQSFEFKEGSNSEKLVIDVEMPRKPGEYKYQIDAIKYIDKQAIKDVNMANGNKFIEFGVTYNSLPTITISNEIVTTIGYSADVNVVDNDNYLENSSGLRAYLFENDKIAKIMKIERSINFTDLKEGYSYSYAIATSKDELDGNGNTTKILFEQSFDTLSMFNIINVKATYDSISYEVEQTNKDAVLKSIFLIDGEDSLDITNQTKVDNLLSDHDYQIKLVFEYKGQLKETIKKVKTLKYGMPSISGFNVETSKDKITFDYEVLDESKVVKEEVVRVYKDNIKIKEVAANSKEVTGLLSNTSYKVDLVLRYDLNDGSGINEVILSKDIKTLNLAKPIVNIIYEVKDTTFNGELVLIDVDNTFKILRYELCDKDGKVLRKIDDISSISDLKINTNYQLKLVYSYNLNDGNGDIAAEFTIKFSTEKQVPTLEISPYYVNETSFGIDIYETDPNVIGEVSAIRLFNELGEFIKQVPADMQFVFDNLVANTKYEIRIYYTYDLNDGNGNQEVIYKYEVTTAKTKPTVDFELESDKYSLTIKPNINDTNNAGNISNIVVKLKDEIIYQGTDLKVLNLLSNNNYSVTLTYTYDLNDLNGQKEIVVSKEIKTKSLTKPSITLNSNNITHNSFDLTYDLIDEDDIFKFISGKVFFNGKESQGFNLDNLSITDLYSNNEYEIRLEYEYDLNDGEGKITDNVVIVVRTLKFEKASVKFTNMSATETEIYFDFIKNDSNNNLKIVKVELFEANNLDKPLKELTDVSTLKFDGLTKASFYKLVVTYTYDLNDGNGVITDKFSQDYGTIGSKLLIKNVEVLNKNSLVVGEDIHLRIYFENPNNLDVRSVKVDGVNYDITQADINNQFVSLKFKTATEGGRQHAIVEGYTIAVRNSLGEEILITENLFDNYQAEYAVLGDLGLEYYGAINDKHYVVIGEKEIELRFNPIYTIKEVKIGEKVYKADEITLVSPGKVLLKTDNVFNDNKLNTVTYSLKEIESKKAYNIDTNYSVVYNKVTMKIKNVEDLTTMQHHYAYEIINDLDFTGFNNFNINFTGVLLGNNQKWNNVSIIANNESLNFNGIFSTFRGYMNNVEIVSPYIVTKDNSGLLAEYIYSSTIENIKIINPYVNCNDNFGIIANNIAESVVNNIEIDGGKIDGHDFIGGIVSTLLRNGIIKNSYINTTITGNYEIGGCASKVEVYSGVNGKILNVVNRSNITANRTAGGILAQGNGNVTIKECVNYGTIKSVKGDGAGIVCAGVGNHYISDCINYGDIYAYDFGAGIIRDSNSSIAEISNIINVGTIYIEDDYTGQKLYGSTVGTCNVSGPIVSGAISLVDFPTKENYTFDYKNCYVVDTSKEYQFHSVATPKQLNDKSWWISIGYDENIWNLDNLDYEKALYPTLRFLSK